MIVMQNDDNGEDEMQKRSVIQMDSRKGMSVFPYFTMHMWFV